jgi:hypothetical protein
VADDDGHEELIEVKLGHKDKLIFAKQHPLVDDTSGCWALIAEFVFFCQQRAANQKLTSANQTSW